MQHTWGAPLTPVRPQSLQGGLPYRSFTILLPMIFSFSPLYRFGVFFPLWNEILIFPHSFIDRRAPVATLRALGEAHRRTFFPISINLTVVIVLLFSFKFLRLPCCFPWLPWRVFVVSVCLLFFMTSWWRHKVHGEAVALQWLPAGASCIAHTHKLFLFIAARRNMALRSNIRTGQIQIFHSSMHSVFHTQQR